MKFAPLLCVALACFAPLCAQTPGTGNLVGNELAFETGVTSLTATDKVLETPAVLTMAINSASGALVGAPFVTVASLAPTGSDPVFDVGLEVGVGGLSLTNFIFVINGLAPPGTALSGLIAAPLIPAAGAQFAVNLAFPCASPLSIYLQTAAPDATKPSGLAFTPALEHSFAHATTLSLGDDASTLYGFQCLSGFDFYGQPKSGAYVNSNGNLTFGAGDTDFSASEAEMLSGAPRIALFWTDLSPNLAGTVDVVESAASLSITFDGVPAFGAPSSLFSGTVTLGNDDSVALSWDALAQERPIVVGISPGNGALPNAQDLTINTSGAALQPLYQVFSGGCGDEAERLVLGTGTFVASGVESYDYVSSVPTQDFVLASPSTIGGDEAGSNTFQISGAFFDASTTYSIEFGAGNFATGVIVLNACTLECTTPAGAGVVDLIVTDTMTNVSATLPSAFTYFPPNLWVESLPVDDDGFRVFGFKVAPAAFTYYGITYSSVMINGNGSLSFGSGDGDFTPTSSEMIAGAPRIAGCWADLASGAVIVTETDLTLSIAFTSDHNGGSGPNAHTVLLDKTTGAISLTYGVNDSFNGVAASEEALVGISPGGGLGANTSPDLNGSSLPLGANDALFETFNGLESGLPFDLDGLTVLFLPTGGVGVGPYQLN